MLAASLTTVLALILLWSAASARADVPLQVPLQVPLIYLENRAADLLDLDAEGKGELIGDDCNRLELSDLQITTDSAPEAADSASPALQLRLDIAVRAHGGASLFGRCRGPAPVEGRVLMGLTPRATAGGDTVLFSVTGAEFRTVDGGQSLLTRPSRALADALLVPRMQNLRVDVSDALAEIDGLLEQFLGEPESPGVLTAGGRLRSVRVVDEGLDVSLAFSLADRETTDRSTSTPSVDEEPGESTAPPPAPVAVISPDDTADWDRLEDEFDGFLSAVVGFLAQRAADRDLQIDLLALLIDVRLQVVDILTSDVDAGGEDPLRRLFLESWDALGRIVSRIPADDREGASLQFASFLAAGDALALADALGPAYGIEISRNGLRRLARLLMEGEAPVSFTPLPRAEDPAFRALFGFRSTDLVPAAEPQKEPSAQGLHWLEHLNPVARAHAAEPAPAEILREIFPQRDNLDLYLGVVASLIDETLTAYWDESRLNREQQALFEPLVRATAWKETCWRHYLPAGDDEGVRVIRSGVGAVGMMQIVGRVWRNLFDLERLEADVDYNLAAGIDILEHYFLDYAVRRGEGERPGGMDNLVRATYSAYNGGPSKLSRYRQEGISARARAVDRQFYDQYKVMRDQAWPSQSACYAR